MSLGANALALVLGAGLSLSPCPAWRGAHAATLQDYPSRPLRFVVPFPPSGSNDIIARSLVPRLSEELRQPIVVDNRGGANGIIGTELAAKSPPDGHTFLIVGNGFTINPSIYRKLPYDPVRDFAPVSLVGNGNFVLVVNPSVAARNVNELVALAKASPGKLTMASAGMGNMAHLTGELFMSMTGTRFVHVPYKGGGPAITELLGGQVSLYFSTVTVALPHIKAGKLRALAVTGAQRAAVAPELPTMAEAGVAGYAVDGWYGILMPGQTPTTIISRFAANLHRVLQDSEVKQRLAAQGIDTTLSTPEQLRKVIAAELVQWAKVVRDAGVQPE
ncbi:MAG: tripartite tricarboxylate transporter substrate binding protein [Proteobacteria bacterium]|nr:tripartite tricarboxylate transporter substrate binding protein [Burkholderiales bacterium]